jgi:hypothetical protein
MPQLAEVIINVDVGSRCYAGAITVEGNFYFIGISSQAPVAEVSAHAMACFYSESGTRQKQGKEHKETKK